MTVLPDTFANTRMALQAAAHHHGDREAYVEPDARMTFVQWVSRAESAAAEFARLGVQKGDIVLLWLPSGIDYAVCYAGAAMIGAVTAGLNPRLGPTEIKAVIDQANPALIVADEQLAAITAGDTAVVSRSSLHELYRTKRQAPMVDVGRTDPVAVLFSSGTTGVPKGAVFDADNLAAGAHAAGVMSAPYDRRLTSTPFAHAGYMFKLWDQLLWGTTLVVPPAPWSAEGMAKVLVDERITVAGAVPTQWAKLLEVDGIDRNALKDLRLGVVASAPAAPELVANVADRIGVPLVVRYAMTECPTISGTEPGDPPEVQFHTVGRPAPGMQVRVRDGIVEVSGPCVMRGYWQRPELTASVLQNGWLRTGDIGGIRDDGNVVITGRSDDTYIRGGFNVQPAEVEQVLLAHPGVIDAVVVGHRTPVIGEIGVAFVAAGATPPSLAELRAWVSARLSDYKAPDRLVVVDEIPRTALLKPDRKELRRRLSAELATD